jgi:hypothetical protein
MAVPACPGIEIKTSEFEVIHVHQRYKSYGGGWRKHEVPAATFCEH